MHAQQGSVLSVMAANAAAFTATLLSDVAPPPTLRQRSGALLIPACMVAMGVSAFPICETLLLQTAVFSQCLGYPEFYGLATMVLFLFGLPLMVLQNKFDQTCDRRQGAKVAAIFRVVLGHSLQLVALLIFLTSLRDIDKSSNTAGRRGLLVVTFSVIGVGTAIVYGAYAQTVSIFPERYHPFFFIGTYLVSWVVAPVNVALGELCTVREPDGSLMETPQVHWDKIFEYYAIGCILNVVGCVMFIVFTTGTQKARQAFQTKDDQLTTAILGSVQQQVPESASWVVEPVNGSMLTSPPPSSPPSSPRPQLAAAESAPPLELCQVWRKCFFVGGVMALCLIENLLVCGEYSRLPIQGQIPSLRTLMMYSYYAAQCVGASVAMIPIVSELLTVRESSLRVHIDHS